MPELLKDVRVIVRHGKCMLLYTVPSKKLGLSEEAPYIVVVLYANL